MIHVLVGSLVPLAVFFAAWAVRRRVTVRALVLLPLASLVSSTIAVVPDLPRLWGDLPRYVDWHHRPWCDLCWGHCAIDRHDTLENSQAWAVCFVIITIAVFAIGWRELVRRERG